MRKVLVVDGLQGGRELLRILLEHEGYQVFEAADAGAALEMARVTLPELILLDMEQPAGDGYTAVREMRGDDRLKDRVILAVTAGASHGERARIADAGFTGYIAKPVILRELREQLGKLTAFRQGQPEA